MTITLHTRASLRHRLVSVAARLGAAGALALPFSTSPAAAQITVFDPTNYTQNVLTVARTLQQIKNQIQSLQNEATSLLNQAKNLTTIRFPEVQAITQKLQAVDQLMQQAQRIRFSIATTDRQYRALFPATFDASLSLNARVATARDRLDASLAALGQTMAVQSQIAENVTADAPALNAIVARSQGAEGALAVGQATNQLLAIGAKQQLQLQSMMAAQYRAEALEAARRVQIEADARAATRKFLGSGSAYTPSPPGS